MKLLSVPKSSMPEVELLPVSFSNPVPLWEKWKVEYSEKKIGISL